jgi:hypothetical protein
MKNLNYSIILASIISAYPIMAAGNEIPSSATNAQSLSHAKSIQYKTNTQSIQSQQQIDNRVAATTALAQEIEQLNDDRRNLELYRDHLRSLVNSQHNEITSLNQQITEVKQTRQGIIPLMYDMIASLEVLISQDVPLKPTVRANRISELKSMMVEVNMSDSEKYRRILDAYQIEVDYGNKLGIDQQNITLPTGETIEVELLHLGRISLIARSLDQRQYWHWQRRNQTWAAADAHLNKELKHAFDVASNTIAPTLLTLPVSVTITEID